MKDMKLIRRVFAGSLRLRDILKSILQYLLIFGLLAVISVSLIEPMYKKRKNTEAYEAYRFDVCVGSCTTETYRQIAQSENVSASLGILQSPLGERHTLPIFTPSGMQLRLNCCVKKRL